MITFRFPSPTVLTVTGDPSLGVPTLSRGEYFILVGSLIAVAFSFVEPLRCGLDGVCLSIVIVVAFQLAFVSVQQPPLLEHSAALALPFVVPSALVAHLVSLAYSSLG